MSSWTDNPLMQACVKAGHPNPYGPFKPVRESEYSRAMNFVAGVAIGVERFKDFYGDTHWGEAEGFIYFIAAGEPQPIWVKVGFTAGNPMSRLKNLQTGCPMPLTLIGFVMGTAGGEQTLHDVLRDRRTVGEWFTYDDFVDRVIRGELDAETI